MPDHSWIDPRHSRYAWPFNQGGVEERDEFLAAFVAHNEEVGIDGASEDFLLLSAPSVFVRFYGISDTNGDYEDMEVEVRSEDGQPLRFLDFMYRLHTLVYPRLIDADHIYFEGLIFQEVRDGVPVVELQQGS